MQIVVDEAPILGSPRGELVARASRGTVLELRRTTPDGYFVLVHTGEQRLVRRQSARPVTYRPLPVEDPALRQQLLAALVEAASRARMEAAARPAGAQRQAFAQLLADRYALFVAQRFSLNPPVVAALATQSGLRGPEQSTTAAAPR